MVKKIGIFFILVSVLFSCSNNENITLGKVEIVKKVKFEQPIIPMSTVINSGNYIAFDALKRRLVMFNKEGKIIDSYEKHGKGPGEFLREEDLFLMGVHNDKLYVLEYAQNRVVIFNISSNENFKYMDEFVVNNGRVITGGISSNGRIYLNEMIGDNLFKIYNETGKQKNEIIRRNQVDLNQLSAKEMKKYFIENIYIPHFDENNIVLTGVFNKHIKFYKKNKETVDLLKDTIIHQYKEKGYNSKTQQSSNNREIFLENIGVAGSNIMDSSYYLAISPENESKSLLNKYSLNGKFEGNYLIEDDENLKIENFFIFDDDDIIFTEAARKNANDDYKRNSNYFYIAKLK